MKSVPHWIAIGALIGAPAMAQTRPAVMELFTSEGCSSCPPAEAYLAELAQRDDVLALAYHVDYWDDLGWPDRFALKAATRRQAIYAPLLSRTSVFTPQVIIDGRHDYVGSDRRSIGKAIATHRPGVSLSLSVDGGDIRIAIGAQPDRSDHDVDLLGYLNKVTSTIHRGENAGRTLQEFHVVRSIQTLGHWKGAAQTLRAPLSSLPADVTDIAVLVQATGQGAIIGAASLKVR